ncbi:hypothetical protein [Limnofasciculus baicalensis]|uniref:Uncharacterized protein n=1 Tax=Limnofasciculus baicalensis BBK-W-15 TaxID=2699891 RepID=A0AAE3KKX6_9CYAN|nr:hypothetical protein [Limnofasciculus baicalensis]MCP2727484.1 hypothetical protein [Limnofasciculus baicalensis BBK-W-15]
MNRDTTPEVDYHNPIFPFGRKFDSPSLRLFSPGEGGKATTPLVLDRNQPLPLDYWFQPPQLDISEILHQLQLFQPIRTSPQQRQLASKALISLRQRRQQDFRIMLSRLAEDVASIVD